MQAEGYFFVPFMSCPPWWMMMYVTSPLVVLKELHFRVHDFQEELRFD
jgi:hypothetical protein